MTETSSSSSSFMKTLRLPWVIGTIAVVAAGVAYAVAFDARRRLDPKFRKQLRKQKKKVDQHSREVETSIASTMMPDIPSIESILNEPFPTTPVEKEAFFTEQLTRGENISKQGPQYYENAAACFYKALKVYPSPTDLLVLFQRTLPAEIFQMILDLISSEVKKRQQMYYLVFPPPEMNVRVEDMPNAHSEKKKALVATRSFEPGEVIFTEEPVVGSLQPELLSSNKYCHYCYKLITDTTRPISKRTQLAYCSDTCEDTAWEKFDALMYSDHARAEGSTTHALVQLCQEKNTVVPLLIAKFLAYMVYEDQKKHQQYNIDEFGVWDHVECMRYMDLAMDDKESKIVKKLKRAVGTKIPGFEEFLTDERYLMLKGKFLYNQYSVVTSEEQHSLSSEMQRCPSDSATAVGFYLASTYLTHSCVPNTTLVFSNQDSRLHLVATQPIAAGDALHVAFVDPSPAYTERKQRLSKWRFTCTCKKCQEEVPQEE